MLIVRAGHLLALKNTLKKHPLKRWGYDLTIVKRNEFLK
jgi:hypothetical protein